MTPTLSIIVPTIGRPTLARTLDALEPQLRAGDEVLVVLDSLATPTYVAADARHEIARRKHSGADWLRYLEFKGETSNFGDPQRNLALRLARGSHVAFIDDDDEHTPDALALFRNYAGEQTCIFRMQHPELGLLWREPVLEGGNVGTPMVLAPNRAELHGAWAPDEPGTRTGDFSYARRACEHFGPPLWRPELVAICHREQPA